MSWTQALCEACWCRKYLIILDGPDSERASLGISRAPTRVVSESWSTDRAVATAGEAPELEICCYCGALTIVGIFIRVDPATVPYPRPEPGEEVLLGGAGQEDGT